MESTNVEKLKLLKRQMRQDSSTSMLSNHESDGVSTETSAVVASLPTSTRVIRASKHSILERSKAGGESKVLTQCERVLPSVENFESNETVKAPPPKVSLSGSSQEEHKNAVEDIVKSAAKQQASISWCCQECGNECIPVRRESRCLCGHRLKEHSAGSSSSSSSSSSSKLKCTASRCPCKHFFFVVAEGAWVLRCRCKHKHTDHDCSAAPFKCSKCPACSGFDSPWVCNCGHSWAAHVQNTVMQSEAEAGAMLHDLCGVVEDPNLAMTAAAAGGGRGGSSVAGASVRTNISNKKSYSFRQDGLV